MNLLYANNAVGTLASPITNAQLTITLNVGGVGLFPNPTAPQVFYATLTDAATETLKEIVKVTAVSGNIFTVVRAQDGTTALSWNANDIIEQCAIRLEMQGWENAAEGNFSAQSVSITPSTTLGIVGTTAGDNANPGSVGEYQYLSPPAVSLTNNITGNVATLPIPAGDWDVSGAIQFSVSGGSPNISLVASGISTSSGNFGPIGSLQSIQASFNSGSTQTLATPTVRVNVSTTTNVFLVGVMTTGSAVILATGFISARRVR